MPRKQLQVTLEELHEALGDAEQIDDDTRAMLKTVTAEIQRLLDEEQSPTEQDVHSVSSELKELLLRFESEHPQLTGILGRIADGLANLGI